MPNTLGACEGIRSLLRTRQLSLYKTHKVVVSHYPTRWAILHLIAQDLIATKEAIVPAVLDEDWDEKSSSSSHHAESKANAISNPFWRGLKLVVQLAQP